MKCLSSAVAGVTALLVLTPAARLYAGVVMAETSFAKSPNGTDLFPRQNCLRPGK
jgi:hypothetical protein